MAEKKTEATVTEPIKVDMNERIPIKLPFDPNDDENVVVFVNMERFEIKRGEVVEVPRYVVEQLQHQERMQILNHRYNSKVRK